MWMGLRKLFWPDVTPDFNVHSQFHPDYGFKEPRQKKVMRATVEEMDSAFIPRRYRDYCAHHYIKLLACIQENFFQRKRCYDFEEKYKSCLYYEALDRHKDFERERRLLVRKKIIKTRQAAMKKKLEQEKENAK